jgi:thiol-disulfide isomerase/thioredoxin
MKALLRYLIILLLPLLAHAQADSLYFSNAIRKNFIKYKNDSESAYRQGDTERGQYLFDSLVDNRLKGTYFDNYKFKKFRGGKFKIAKTTKPVVIITYASWCIPGTGEIPAINKLAKKYKKEVQYVVIFWDRRHNMKKMASKFSKNVTVCYAHESYRNDAPIVSSLKHTLGFPTSFYLDEEHKVVDIRRCSDGLPLKKTQYNKGYALNYNKYLEGLHGLLMNFELKKEMLAIK